MNDNADSKFVSGLFSLLSWVATMGPLVYAIYVHAWIWLSLLVVAEVGAVIALAIKNVDKS